MSITDRLPDPSDLRPRLTVVGVGGAGCNAINNMIATGLSGVDFIVANTDAQALTTASTDLRIQLGAALTEGLGAGSRPEIGEAAAEEAIEEIRTHIKGSHMVFIAAGMGGGTGTGAASVIARAARELGILTVGVVTKPFLFEGARRMRIAEAGVAELRNYVDTLIVIPNQNLFRIASEKTTFAEAFVMADQVLYSGVACIVDLILKEGLINLDFADVRTVMSGMGTAMMGTGEATGERRATIAAEEAISNPLLDDVSLRGAKGLLLSITGGPSLTLYEVDEAASRVRQEVDPEANIIVGATYDPDLADSIRVSIVASGMSRAGEAERRPPAPADDWIHGTRQPVGRPEPERRTQQSFVPEPRDFRSGAHDLQQRLTEALQYAPSANAHIAGHQSAGQQSAGHQSGHAPAQQAPRGEAQRRPGDAWRGPGDVMIEDAAPQLQAATPPPLPPGYGAGHQSAGPFAPQPPAEVRRPSQAGQPQHYQGRDAPPPPQAPQQRRRVSLFERITGRARDTDDSPQPAPVRADSYQAPPRQAPPAPDEVAHRGYDDGPQNSRVEAQQDVELPVFFRERRH